MLGKFLLKTSREHSRDVKLMCPKWETSRAKMSRLSIKVPLSLAIAFFSF